MLFGWPSSLTFPTLLWHTRQLLFWFLSVHLRTDVQRLCAGLPRSDALRLTEFIAIPTPLWHICQLLFWFLSVVCARKCNAVVLICCVLMLFN